MTQDEFNALPVSQQIKELKVQAYNFLGQIEFLQKNLQSTNQQIAQLSQQPVELVSAENQEVEE